MDKSDVEMEDAKESKNGEEEEAGVPTNESEASNADMTKMENQINPKNGEEEEAGVPTNESEASNTDMTKMENQINPTNEVNKPIDSEVSVEEQIDIEKKNNWVTCVRELGKKWGGKKLKIKLRKSPLAIAGLEDIGEGPELSTHESKDDKVVMSQMEGQNSPYGAAEHASDDFSFPILQEPVTPDPFAKLWHVRAEDDSVKTIFTQVMLPPMAEDDGGTPEELAKFMKELEIFHLDGAMGFDTVKFYGEPLNLLKLWRSVIRLGGYDQVGELFHPSKACTTVFWTFRNFYEKYLLEYEMYKTQRGELQLPGVMPSEPETPGADRQRTGHLESGSERARREAASHSVQGSHAQHDLGHSEAGQPTIKDKNPSNMSIPGKNSKSNGSIKQKRPNDVDNSIKTTQTETSKQQVIRSFDVGPRADWVKINVLRTREGFEVFVLVPGLLREEVRVQADPAGSLAIIGQPQGIDRYWGVTAFKKIVHFPWRINPRQTCAFINQRGRLYVHIPYESKKSS